MHCLKNLVLLVGLTALAGGCQTAANRLPATVEAKLEAAGYERSAETPSAPAGQNFVVNGLYVCKKERCGHASTALRATAIASPGIGGITAEEAIRRRQYKDATLQDIMEASMKTQHGAGRVTRFAQFSRGGLVGLDVEATGRAKDGTPVYAAGRTLVKDNTATLDAVVSTNRSVAARGLSLLSGH
ncbi:hypothetical protein [Bosea sp. (in: a-proteobacteria)]|uniref:hypothetical protein n=1 Tax=Bosea sp. (in: a-proteobacteria) TaxID=1871050 RepID=UPI003F6E927E